MDNRFGATVVKKLPLLNSERHRYITKLKQEYVMRIFHNPRCSKSRQTLQLIRQSQHEVEVIEYLQNPPTVEQLRTVIELLGLEASSLVRKGEAVFRELDVDLVTLSDDAVIELLVAHPILIQRPIVVGNGKAVIGRPPENVLQLWS